MNSEDHDALVTLMTTQTNMCKKFDKMEVKMDAVIEKKVDWGRFLLIIGGLIGILGGIVGYNFKMDTTQFKLINEQQHDLNCVQTDIAIIKDRGGDKND
jgi:hypothetical protein